MSAQTDIAADLTRILGAKSDLKASIGNKGVTVPAATKIDGYAALVDQIQQGGGGHTGTVDTAGLQALGWDSYDIQWLQDHVWWDAEDDAEWAVTEANKAFGPNGATPLTWNTRSSIQYNPDCRYLPKLTLPNNINSFYSAFIGYYNLVAIPTHGWDLSAVTRYDQAFRMCYNLRSIGDISYWVTSTCTNIGTMFTDCYKLSDIDVSHWNTSNITSFANLFQNCLSFESIDISGFSFAKATSAASMFSGCISLISLKLPASINAPLLTNFANFAQNCYALKIDGITLDAPLLTSVNASFSGCVSLTSFKLSISSTVVSNMNAVLGGCQGLVSLDLTNIDTTSCAQSGIGTISDNSPVGAYRAAATIKLGANFFKGSFTTLYATYSYSWTRDSIYESLYTNQTSRDSNSNAVTVKLTTQAYDRLSAQDISDIATKNITLTRG